MRYKNHSLLIILILLCCSCKVNRTHKSTIKPNIIFITDLTLEAGMKYINLTTSHHDSFCFWDTKNTDFNSVNSPAKRDLVAELSEQCNKKGLAFFLYYSHGRDWRHPHASNNDTWKGAARPE